MKQEKEGLSPLTGHELQILCQSSKTMQEGWAFEFNVHSVRLQADYYYCSDTALKFCSSDVSTEPISSPKKPTKNQTRSNVRKGEEKLEIT